MLASVGKYWSLIHRKQMVTLSETLQSSLKNDSLIKEV